MKTQSSETTISPAPEDRLIDAMIREHARLGTGADEFLLTKLDRALTAAATPASSASRRVFRIAGIAAGVALALGLVWKFQSPGNDPQVAASEAARAAGGGTFLSTDLPAETLEGTPSPMNLPRLIAVPTAAPTMRVPEGTVLLSHGKPVTSSDSDPIIGSLDLITDGDKDAGEGYFVELLDGLQWVQIDLEQQAEIQAVWVWHYHSQRRAYHDVIVQISDDPMFQKNVTTVFNNDYDNSSGMGRGSDHPYVESRFGLLVDAKGTPGRYVRLYSDGNTANDMNHYIEVEVFGIPR
jgi:hypothetical protein